jgi:hypothetical protein
VPLATQNSRMRSGTVSPSRAGDTPRLIPPCLAAGAASGFLRGADCRPDCDDEALPVSLNDVIWYA